jgi:hypothetical protein
MHNEISLTSNQILDILRDLSEDLQRRSQAAAAAEDLTMAEYLGRAAGFASLAANELTFLTILRKLDQN